MFIPLLTLQTTEILTYQNWLDLGVNTLAYRLEGLLIKPGAAHLFTQPSLTAYTGWSGQVLLDISTLHTQRTLCSPFDGSRIRIDEKEVEQLIEHLKPDQVISDTASLTALGVTDEPMKLAIAGQVCVHSGERLIADGIHQQVYEVLESGCACPPCRLGLTRAYLHHLWFHVPQLCIRFLAQHNVWTWEKHGLVDLEPCLFKVP